MKMLLIFGLVMAGITSAKAEVTGLETQFLKMTGRIDQWIDNKANLVMRVKGEPAETLFSNMPMGLLEKQDIPSVKRVVRDGRHWRCVREAGLAWDREQLKLELAPGQMAYYCDLVMGDMAIGEVKENQPATQFQPN